MQKVETNVRRGNQGRNANIGRSYNLIPIGIWIMEAHKSTLLVSSKIMILCIATPNVMDHSIAESLQEASAEQRRDIEQLKKYAK